MNYRKAEAKEAAREQFRGLWAAITTPFTPDNRIDEAGLRRNMRHFTEVLHVEGIFCTGTMGEFWALTKEERKRVVEIVVEEARGKCRVIPHTGHHSVEETVDLTLHAQAAGADFAIVINPYYPAANDEMLYRWFAQLSERTEIGIWMFDTAYSGVELSAAVTARIAELPNICGIKCSRPLPHYADVKRLCGDRIVMSHPSESDWLTLMRDYGARVHMSSAAPFIYQTARWQPMREYTELALSGRFAEAETVAQTLAPVRKVHQRWMRDPWVKDRVIAIGYLKAWMEELGLVGGPVRAPLLLVTVEERAQLKADVEHSGLLVAHAASREPRAA
jgi:4-hydroxy-tetrahydrodipicolinate synthase